MMWLRGLSVLAGVLSVSGHICVVYPHQRGALDISTAGNPTCFHHGAPCGGIPSGDVETTLNGGDAIHLHWQQNYNHYAIGHPGYMDFAYAEGPNPSDSDFKVLAAIPDYFAHWQGAQKNFTLAVTIPDVDCEHCVIRARYDSQKPGENIFYQCADVSITSSRTRLASSRLVMQPTQEQSSTLVEVPACASNPPQPWAFGVYWSTLGGNATFEAHDPNTGCPIYSLPLNIDSLFPPKASGPYGTAPYELEGIMAYDRITSTGYVLASQNLQASGTSYVLVPLPPKGAFSSSSEIAIKTPSPISAISRAYFLDDPSKDSKFFIALAMEETDASTNTYDSFLEIIELTEELTTTVTPLKANFNLQPGAAVQYVNFMWMELREDSSATGPAAYVYALFQNENDSNGQGSILYQLAIDTSDPSSEPAVSVFGSCILDVSEFTIQAFHLDYSSGYERMFALSPGLVANRTNPQWSLVEITFVFGGSCTVKEISKVGTQGQFRPYYGTAGAVSPGDKSAVVRARLDVMKNGEPDTYAGSVYATVPIDGSPATFSPVVQMGHQHNLFFSEE